MYNILNLEENGLGVMLDSNVDLHSAYYWLDYYRCKYGEGVPYYNGKGVHKGIFIIVRQSEANGLYYALQ